MRTIVYDDEPTPPDEVKPRRFKATPDANPPAMTLRLRDVAAALVMAELVGVHAAGDVDEWARQAWAAADALLAAREGR